MKFKKFLAAIISVAMIISCVNFTTFAEETSTEVVADTAVAKVGNTEYATIDDAIANWTDKTTLTLLSDVTLSDVITLKSTEHHILDLGTYTMTAAKNKDAIQIENNGRSNASYALDIKADAGTPGGITATGKAVVRTAGKSGVKDRPIIRFYGGAFNASYIVYHTGSNGTNCPQFQFHGGEFNGTIYTNRTLNQFYGGTFNGSLMMSVDSSAYTLIAGGTFKQLSNLYMSALNSDKFTIGSAKGKYDKEVYIDDNGNYVIAAAEPAQGIEAAVAKTPGTNDYLKYSKVGTEGNLNYTDVDVALNNNTSAKVTVYTDTLDLTGSKFKGTIVVPEGNTLRITNAPAGLKVTDTAGKELDALEVNGELIYGDVPAPEAPAWEGEGTSEAPYVIADLDGLKAFQASVNSGEAFDNVYFKLEKDIDLAADAVSLMSADVTPNWEPIGTKENPFKGTFDGNGKTISNLIVVGEANQGYFGYADNATIKNINIENATVTGTDCVGAVAGQVYSTSTIENCHVSGNIQITGQTNVGGIVGKYYTKVTNSSVIGDGIETSFVKGEYVAADLEGDNVGGIMGHCGENNNLSGNTVKNITVSGTRKVGGIVGIADQNTDVSGCVVDNIVVETTATEDYAASNVATMSIGGLIGQYQKAGDKVDGTVENSTVSNVKFVIPDGVVCEAGVIAGGARGGTDGMLPPSDKITVADNTVTNVTGATNNYLMPVYDAYIGETGYETLAEAVAAAKTMTGDVTVEIYDKVTLNQNLNGSYSSIKFVGKADNAEIYIDLQGYIEANGKNVSFENLILSKSAGGHITNAGFMNVAFGVYEATTVNYTNCTFTNGAYASKGINTFTDCTFYRSHDKYGLWAYGDVEVVVDNCKFDDYRGIKMYAEGAAKTVALTVKDTDFSAVTDKPAIVLTYGESVTLEGNTYSSTGVFELDLDGAPNGTPVTGADVKDATCVNDNGACGVLVDGKIYTTVAQAAEVAAEGSTVILLHNSTETVEFAEGVTLDKNGFTAENITVTQPGLSGSGIAEDPYKIGTKEELFFFASKVNDGTYKGVYAELTADINLEQEDWTPIGTSENPFTGTFDGLGHTISNVWVTINGNAGLFGQVAEQSEKVTGTVQNLTVDNATIIADGQNSAGVIAVARSGAQITNVKLTGEVTIQGYRGVGGIVGNGFPTMNNCSVEAEGSITATYWGAGGILGFASDKGAKASNSTVTATGEGLTIHGRSGGVGAVTGTPHGAATNGAVISGVQITSNNNYCMGYVDASGTVSGTVTVTDVTVKVNGEEIVGCDAVASIGDAIYFDLNTALKALTSGATLTLLSDITIDYYWDCRYTGGKITVPVTIDGNEHTLKFTETVYDGGNHMSVFRFEEAATVKNLTIDMSEAKSGWGTRFRAISSKAGDLTVDNCKFIGNGAENNTRAIIFGESADASTLAETNIVVTNSTFEGWGRGVSDNENAKDVATVKIEENKFNDANVFVSAKTSVEFNKNEMENAWANITSYSDESALSIVAKENTLCENDISSTLTTNQITNFATKDVQEGFWFPVTNVAEVNGVGYETLQDAFTAAVDGKIVKLIDNVELDAPITIAKDASVTLDLNGYDVTYTSDVSGEAMFTNNGNFTIDDTSENEDGKIVYTYTGDADTTYGKGNYAIYNHGKLTVNAGTVQNATEKMSHAYYTISCYTGAEVTVNGGEIICDTSRTIRLFTSSENDNITLTVNNGKITGTSPVYVQLASNEADVAPEVNVNINGGELTATDDYNMVLYSYNYGNNPKNVSINVTNGTLNGDILVTGGKTKTDTEKVNITGGTFNGNYGVHSYANEEVASGNIVITGGTYNTDYAEKYTSDDGYIFTTNTDGTYGVVEKEEEDLLDTDTSFIRNISTTNSNGDARYQVILFCGIDSLKYKEVGFEITVAGKTVERGTDTVYKQYTAAGTTYYPKNWGDNCKYISGLKINFQTNLKDESVTFRPYVENFDGSKVYGIYKTIDKIYNK